MGKVQREYISNQHVMIICAFPTHLANLNSLAVGMKLHVVGTFETTMKNHPRTTTFILMKNIQQAGGEMLGICPHVMPGHCTDQRLHASFLKDPSLGFVSLWKSLKGSFNYTAIPDSLPVLPSSQAIDTARKYLFYRHYSRAFY